MGQKQEEKQEKMSIDEKVEALHAWEAGEGFEPTDFAGDDGEVETYDEETDTWKKWIEGEEGENGE